MVTDAERADPTSQDDDERDTMDRSRGVNAASEVQVRQANATNEKYEKLEGQLGNITHRQSSTAAMCVGKTVHRT